MVECLEALEIPEEARNVLKTLYNQGWCSVAQGHSSYKGLEIGAGIRQGCPLSPLIFVTVMDILLRTMDKTLEGGHLIGAFADDIGVVLHDAEKQLPQIASIVKEFSKVSAMEICFLFLAWQSHSGRKT